MTGTKEMEQEQHVAALAARLASVEAAVARLTSAVERVADAVADARPLVLTAAQLTAAVRAAMDEATRDGVETATTTPANKKRKTTTTTRVDEDLATRPPSPPPLMLSMLDMALDEPVMVSPSPPSPLPLLPPPPAPKPAKKRAPRAAVAPPQPPPPPVPAPTAPLAPVCRPPLVAPTRPALVVPAPPQPQLHPHPPVVTPVQPNVVNGQPSAQGVYLWGNAWHHLPENYEFPKASLETMWRQWCCGVPEQGFRPLRDIQAKDIASTSNRKRLSDLKFIMKYIEQHLQERGVWKESPTETEAEQMLRAASGAMPFTSSQIKNGQKRELEDLKWHSAVTLLRNANKKQPVE